MLDIMSKEYENMIDEMKSGKERVITPWGRTKIDKYGYYRITSAKEGNNSKRVHVLIWESFYGKSQPHGYNIHHIDGNKLNNSIQNLQCCDSHKHHHFHFKGENNPMWNKSFSKEYKQKLSEAKKGGNHPQSKYENLWDIEYVAYDKSMMFRNNCENNPNPRRCFYLKYYGQRVKMGGFLDFVTVEIISKLIRDGVG